MFIEINFRHENPLKKYPMISIGIQFCVNAKDVHTQISHWALLIMRICQIDR